VRILDVPGERVTSLQWDESTKHLAACNGACVFLAEVQVSPMWGQISDPMLYVQPADKFSVQPTSYCVHLLGMHSAQKHAKRVPGLLILAVTTPCSCESALQSPYPFYSHICAVLYLPTVSHRWDQDCTAVKHCCQAATGKLIAELRTCTDACNLNKADCGSVHVLQGNGDLWVHAARADSSADVELTLRNVDCEELGHMIIPWVPTHLAVTESHVVATSEGSVLIWELKTGTPAKAHSHSHHGSRRNA